MKGKTKFDFESLVIILVVVVVAMPLVFGGVTVDKSQPLNLSDNDEGAASSNTRISADLVPITIQSLVVNGSNVYVAWFNSSGTSCTASTCGVIFKTSADNGTTFSAEIKLGTSPSVDPRPQIAVGSAGNVFVVWQDGQRIKVRASSDSGATFAAEKDIGFADPPGNDQARPQIVANSTGDNVYVAWTDTNRYKLVRSNDTFATFSSADDIGTVDDGGGVPQFPTIKLAVSKTHLHIITQELDEIIVKSSGSNGTTGSFGSPKNHTLDTDIGSITNEGFPHIVANFTGSEVYAVWKEAANINFTRSTDNGTSFVLPTTPSDGLLGSFATNSFSIFPEIAIGEQGRVFVVWEDDTGNPNVIKFRNSTDEGDTFAPAQTLSGTVTGSNARIAASDGNVYVVWRENPDSTNFDKIILNSSSNNGKSFGSVVSITDDNANDLTPQVAAVNDKVSIVWQSHTTAPAISTTGEINYTSATGVAVSITFNATNFKLGEAAQITIVDESSNTDAASKQKINVPVTSATDSVGITLSFTETGINTGIFTNTTTFTRGSGSVSSISTDNRILNVTSGDTITATHQTVTGTASIFPITFTFSEADGDYTVTQQPRFNVTAKSFNLDDNEIETIVVTVTSKEAADSLTLTLTEITDSPGVFGGKGPKQKNLVLANSTVPNFPAGRTGTITSSTNDVDVITSSDPTFATQEKITDFALTETFTGSGIFTAKITLGSTTAGSTIAANNCDTLTIRDNTLDQNRLVTPCSDNAIDSLIVLVRVNGQADTMTVTFDGISSTNTIQGSENEQGGGGGALVRPSLVLDILASLGTSGGGGGGPAVSLSALRQSNFIAIPDEIEQVIINFDPFTPLEPFDVNAEQFETFDFPFSIDNDGYALSGYSNTLDTKTLNTGEATKIKTVFYMTSKLEHVAFYTNIREGDSLDDSDAFLRFYKSEDEQLQIKDENGFFEYIDFTIEKDGIKQTATFDIKFLKPMPKSDIVLRMWDQDLRSTTVLIFDAIEVVDPSIEQLEEPAPEDLEIPEPGTTIPETSELRIGEPPVPDWIKTNAKWWNDDHIRDTDFARGIEYLIENNILKVPQTETFEQEQVQEIPGWVKNNAGWWGDGLLRDQDFVNGIQWLIKNGIMKIQINS